MTKLRCWPGALCQINASGEFAGLHITVTRLDDDPASPEPGWFYEGKPLVFRDVCGFMKKEQLTFYDRILVPLTPPPGTKVDEVLTDQEEPVAA